MFCKYSAKVQNFAITAIVCGIENSLNLVVLMLFFYRKGFNTPIIYTGR